MMRRLHVASISSAVVIVLVGAWLHRSSVVARADRLSTLNHDLEELQQAGDISCQRQRLLQLQHDSGMHSDVLSLECDMADILDRLTRDLADLNIRNQSWTIDLESKVDSFEQTPLNITFNGSFSSVHDLLVRIADYPGIVRLERLVIRRGPSTSPDHLAISMQLNVIGSPSGSLMSAGRGHDESR